MANEGRKKKYKAVDVPVPEGVPFKGWIIQEIDPDEVEEKPELPPLPVGRRPSGPSAGPMKAEALTAEEQEKRKQDQLEKIKALMEKKKKEREENAKNIKIDDKAIEQKAKETGMSADVLKSVETRKKILEEDSKTKDVRKQEIKKQELKKSPDMTKKPNHNAQAIKEGQKVMEKIKEEGVKPVPSNPPLVNDELKKDLKKNDIKVNTEKKPEPSEKKTEMSIEDRKRMLEERTRKERERLMNEGETYESLKEELERLHGEKKKSDTDDKKDNKNTGREIYDTVKEEKEKAEMEKLIKEGKLPPKKKAASGQEVADRQTMETDDKSHNIYNILDDVGLDDDM